MLILQMSKDDLMELMKQHAVELTRELSAGLEIRLRHLIDKKYNAHNNMEFLTVADLMRILDMSEPTILSLCHDPNFPAKKVGGKWRINRRQFEEWWQNQIDEES